jgi:hypothetical protein
LAADIRIGKKEIAENLCNNAIKNPRKGIDAAFLYLVTMMRMMFDDAMNLGWKVAR